MRDVGIDIAYCWAAFAWRWIPTGSVALWQVCEKLQENGLEGRKEAQASEGELFAKSCIEIFQDVAKASDLWQ